MITEIITKEYFNEIMTNIYNVCNYQNGLNNYFSRNGADGYIYQPDCVDTTIKLLHNIFKERDKDEWISYFCFELDFGEKYKDGMVKNKFGKNIPLKTYDDLYALLTE